MHNTQTSLLETRWEKSYKISGRWQNHNDTLNALETAKWDLSLTCEVSTEIRSSLSHLSYACQWSVKMELSLKLKCLYVTKIENGIKKIKMTEHRAETLRILWSESGQRQTMCSAKVTITCVIA